MFLQNHCTRLRVRVENDTHAQIYRVLTQVTTRRSPRCVGYSLVLFLPLHQGYAYVEFVSPEVALIVAETMNGYFLFDKQLVCRVLRFDEIHPNLFDGAGIKFRKVNWHGLYRQKYNVGR